MENTRNRPGPKVLPTFPGSGIRYRQSKELREWYLRSGLNNYPQLAEIMGIKSNNGVVNTIHRDPEKVRIMKIDEAARLHRWCMEKEIDPPDWIYIFVG